MNWTIEYFCKTDGRAPVGEFIDSLSDEAQAKALFVIDLLQMKGIFLREPYVKKIQGIDKLFELRFTVKGTIFRIFFFPVTERKFILLHGFIKKSDKTPQREIDIAVKYMRTYQQRGL
jgi:phage-related protein